MSKSSHMFNKMEDDGFEFIENGPRIFEFEEQEYLADFLRDAAINCLIESAQIDYRRT